MYLYAIAAPNPEATRLCPITILKKSQIPIMLSVLEVIALLVGELKTDWALSFESHSIRR